VSEWATRAHRAALSLAIAALLTATDRGMTPVAAEDLARGPTYSTSYRFTPATRQALLVPPAVDPEQFAKAQKLPGYEIVRIPADFSTYGGWALVSFQGSEEDAQKICKDNPALKVCELDRCREFLPASESGFVPGLGPWRPEKEFAVAMAEGGAPSGNSPSGGTTGASQATVDVSGSNAVAQIREQPPTPEQFVRGDEVPYGPEAAKGPELTTLPAGTTSKRKSARVGIKRSSGRRRLLRLSPEEATSAARDLDRPAEGRSLGRRSRSRNNLRSRRT
jgi:hypothetical protein